MNLVPLKEFKRYSIDCESGLIYSHKSHKYLTIKPNNLGYARTELYHNGRRKHIFNHIKLVELYGDKYGVKIPENCISLRRIGLSIDHVNMDKMDCSRSNLELIKHSENVQRYYDSNNADCLPDL